MNDTPAVIAMAEDDARHITDAIRGAVAFTWDLVQQAYEGRAWQSLGYTSWDAYCDAEFGTSRLRLPREDRTEIVCSLRDAGMSRRAIGSATGLGYGTVQRELSGDPNGSPAVTGLDGKTYPKTGGNLPPVPADWKFRSEQLAERSRNLLRFMKTLTPPMTRAMAEYYTNEIIAWNVEMEAVFPGATEIFRRYPPPPGLIDDWEWLDDTADQVRDQNRCAQIKLDTIRFYTEVTNAYVAYLDAS